MATLNATIDPVAPDHGDTVTLTMTVTGNDGTPPGDPRVSVINCSGKVGDEDAQVTVTITLPGTPGVDPLLVSFNEPTSIDLTFQATADPSVWTALVP